MEPAAPTPTPARTLSVAPPAMPEPAFYSPYVEPAAPPPLPYASPVAPVATPAFQPATPPQTASPLRVGSAEQQPLRRSNPTIAQADGSAGAAAPPQPSPPQLKHNAVQIEISALRNARVGSVEQAPVRRANPTIAQSDPRPIADLPRAVSPNPASKPAAVVNISGYARFVVQHTQTCVCYVCHT